MMKSCVAIICVLCAILAAGCNEEEGGSVLGSERPFGTTPTGTGTSQPSSDSVQDWCPSNTYVGDLHGAPATARLGYEIGLTVIYVGGEVTSQSAHYTFSGCELYRDDYTGMPTNDLCWVDVVGHSGERFRAELHFYDLSGQRGFYLTSNAYEGLYSTSYNFTCQ